MRDKDPLSDLIQSIEENLQGGGWEPVDKDAPPPASGNPRRFLWYLLPLLLLLFFNRILGFYTNFIWYDSVGLASVFSTRLYASLTLMAVGAVTFWIFFAVNIFIARRIDPFALRGTSLEQTASALKVRIAPVLLIIGGVIAFFVGVSTSSAWEEVLVYLNQTDFGLLDPLFHKDVSFYVFTLPIWQYLRNWLMMMVIITLIATALISGVGWQGWNIRRPVRIHLSILGALVLLLVAWQYRLDAYGLVYSHRGAIFGAGYSDVNAQLPAYNILAVLTLIAALLLVVTAFLPQAWRAMAVVLVVWFGASILAGSVYPSLVQRFQVNPNELNLERPYLENNIEFTRAGFALNEIEERDYDASEPLTTEVLLDEPETILNIRLWDYRPLLQTYNQVQALRQYYVFNDVDIDRYIIDDEMRQVMLAARELVPDQLAENAQTWVNRRLVYTHGYGVAVSPVAQVTREGQPEFYVKDLPPQGVIPITQPQIYFGELADDYVIAATEEPEFDYPRENGNSFTSFEGDTGIRMSFLNRLIFALRFADINIILNSDIRPDSQLLWRRNIVERIQEVAPFLQYDSDPYIVIGDDGGLYWFLDAYTVSGRFPYSERVGNINYIRNPVKVVTSAYDGTMKFYLFDETEPIAAAYSQIFPELFTSADEMPEDLLAHIRYPNDFFSWQAEVFRTYHMTDPNEFYNKEDLWAWPMELFESGSQRMEPYYVLMQLPDGDSLDFIQILPFTPVGRENMLAWLAAQSEPDKYGEKIVYSFGKDSLVYGPQQIDARIDQDPDISALFSLWNDPQQGSSVIRGNLLVIPVNQSLLYVEPLYLQADTGKIPELKRVIVATADEVVMAENLGLALTQLFGEELLNEDKLAELFTGAVALAETASAGGPTAGADVATASVAELIVLANTHYANAQEHLRELNWTAYGVEMQALQTVLEQLVATSGVELPEPEPDADASPDGGSDTGADADAETEAESVAEPSGS